MARNEADTRAQLIDPKLEAAGWGASQIGREHYYRRDVQYTAGRIVLRGERAYHRDAHKVGYVLRCTEAFPIAVVEAKAEGEEPEAGLEQAKQYARDLVVRFAYATNGHHIIEYDFFARCSTEFSAFPGPARLWQRWVENIGFSEDPTTRQLAEARVCCDPDQAAARRLNPLLHTSCPESNTAKIPRYFQQAAVNAIVHRVRLGRRELRKAQ